jgi:uncharacterized protein
MKSMLFVWGGWEGHEPKQCVDVFAPIMRAEGFEVEISDTLDIYRNTEKMRSFDLICSSLDHGQHYSDDQLLGLAECM